MVETTSGGKRTSGGKNSGGKNMNSGGKGGSHWALWGTMGFA